MELVGRVTRTQTVEDGRIQAEFLCTNKEVFCFFVPPAIQPPMDALIRCFTHRLEKEEGSTGRENVLDRWEKL